MILITGGGGFVGSQLSALYSERGENTISSVFQKPNPFEKEVASLKTLRIDLTSPFSIPTEVTRLIHCASQTPSSHSNLRQMANENKQIQENITRALKESNVEQFIFCSSMSVYGKPLTGEIKETLEQGPTDLYGQSKLDSERYFKENLKPPIKFSALRLPGAVGFQSHSNFLSSVIKKILNQEDIEVLNPDENFNNITTPYDIYLYIEHLPKLTHPPLISHVAADKSIKVKEVIELIRNELGHQGNAFYSKTKEGSFTISIENMTATGFNPRSVREHLKTVIFQIQNHTFKTF